MITQSLSKGKFILSLGKLDFLAFGNYCGPTAVSVPFSFSTFPHTPTPASACPTRLTTKPDHPMMLSSEMTQVL